MTGGRTAKHRELLGQDFIEKSKSLYPGQLEYTKVIYWNETTRVTLTCKIHGDFEAIPKSHLTRGKCCKHCAKESYLKAKGMSKESAISEFKRAHGDRYDYNRVPEHLSNATKIQIECPKHGLFLQTAGSHKEGKGCRPCGYETAGGSGSYNQTTLSRLSAMPNAIFYLIELFGGGERFLKAGITLRDSKKRIKSTVFYKGNTIKEISLPLDAAYELEQLVLSVVDKHEPEIKFSGHTECFNSIFHEAMTAL